jgi:hypothetical protein
MKAELSRRNFLKTSAFVGSAAAIAMSSPAALFGQSVVMAADGDLAILQFGYTLETVAIAAYTAAAGLNILPQAVLNVALKFVAQHTDHKNALGAAIKQVSGKDAVAPAGPFNFPALKSTTDILTFAHTLESVAVGTYWRSIAKFQNQDLAKAAASIIGIEAQHVAILAAALGMDPLPESFVVGTPSDQIDTIATSLLSTSSTGPKMPNTGMGGTSGSNNHFNETVFGLLAAASATAAAALLITRKQKEDKSASEAE